MFHAVIVELAHISSDTPHNVIHRVIDDVAGVSPAGSTVVEKFFMHYVEICRRTDTALAPFDPTGYKAFLGMTKGVVLGILYDTTTLTWSFAEDKIRRLYWDIADAIQAKEVTAQKMASITGKIINFSTLYLPGKFERQVILEANQITAEMMPTDTYKVSEALSQQLSYWLLVVKVARTGLPIPDPATEPPANCIKIHTDAAGGYSKSNNGCGSYRQEYVGYPTHMTCVRWPANIQAGQITSMSVLELMAALIAFTTDINFLAGRQVCFYIDNTSSVRCWRRGYSSKDKLASVIVKALHQVSASVGSTIFTKHVPRRTSMESNIADDLSKGSFARHAVRFFGADSIIAGKRFPRAPRSITRWLKNPIKDPDLGPKIISDLIMKHPNIVFHGYNKGRKSNESNKRSYEDMIRNEYMYK